MAAVFEPLTPVITHLLDKTISFIPKMWVAIFTIAILVLIDNATGFTYYRHVSNKLTEIEKLHKLQASTSDTVLRQQFLVLEQQLLSEEPWHFRLFNGLFQSINSNKTTANINKYRSSKDLSLMVITSCWLYALLIIASFFAILKFPIKGQTIKTIGAGILFILFIALIGFFQYCAFNLIPIILGNPIFNYILNVILSLHIMYLMFKINNLSGKNPFKQTS